MYTFCQLRPIVMPLAYLQVRIMVTQILEIHNQSPHRRFIRMAAEALAKGGIVLCPTETGYCLLGDAQLESTQKSFLALRQAHPSKKPFSLLCKSVQQMGQVATITTSIFRVATRTLPGPYTFIVEANRKTPKCAGLSKRKTVGIRISNHPVTQAIFEEFENPLLITSITDAEELEITDYFNDDEQKDAWWTNAESICSRFPQGIALALNSTEAIPMRVSTVVDFTQDPPVIVRDGGWEHETLGLIE
jgi:tRNA threonylcarbamoyl adenosine modification protein (Sua5/YciO/YrdC/YwlC family)